MRKKSFFIRMHLTEFMDAIQKKKDFTLTNYPNRVNDYSDVHSL